MILLVDSLGMDAPFLFVADACYASGKIVRGLLARGNIDLERTEGIRLIA